MALTESSKSSNVIYCCVRKQWVKKTPEERIRQTLLSVMIEKLGFPYSLLAVEKSLDQLPHLKQVEKLPQRRADILCFTKNMKPLLLIECKKERIDNTAIEQVRGYNAFVQAPFIALADEKGVFFLCGKELKAGLPHYDELLKAVHE
jgi:type I site-specific restriction endonuclease